MTNIPTPMLDKARGEELTSGEIETALRELAKLNAPVSSPPGLVVEWRTYRFRAAVDWNVRRDQLTWHDCVEDALVAERDGMARLIEEGAAQGRRP